MIKLGYESVRIIRFLGVIYIQQNRFTQEDKTIWVYKIVNLYIVAWDYAGFIFARYYTLSQNHDYEPLILFCWARK